MQSVFNKDASRLGHLLCLGNLNKKEELPFIYLEFSKILMCMNVTKTVNTISFEEALMMVRKMGIYTATVR